MGRFSCPECAEPTSVIETRLSNSRIRRRRCCPGGHRFNTIELPVEIQAKLHELIKWFEKHIDEELMEYAHDQLDCIILGTDECDEEPEPGTPA